MIHNNEEVWTSCFQRPSEDDPSPRSFTFESATQRMQVMARDIGIFGLCVSPLAFFIGMLFTMPISILWMLAIVVCGLVIYIASTNCIAYSEFPLRTIRRVQAIIILIITCGMWGVALGLENRGYSAWATAFYVMGALTLTTRLWFTWVFIPLFTWLDAKVMACFEKRREAAQAAPKPSGREGPNPYGQQTHVQPEDPRPLLTSNEEASFAEFGNDNL